LHAVLLRAARWAVQQAARLEAAAAQPRVQAVEAALRWQAHAPPGAVRWVEAAVCVAVAAYYVAGLVGIVLL
jgi:hypothetical protein